MARVIALCRIAGAALGFYLAFYHYFDGRLEKALDMVALLAVALLGLLSWAGHFLFHKSDAKDLGWEVGDPAFQFEVGFANLAFGLSALIAYLAGLGPAAKAITILAYAIYLAQACLLHAWRNLSKDRISWPRLLRSVVLSGLMAGMMAFFAIQGLLSL